MTQDLNTIINVHSYESLGTYDGPGIRLVVFLQGCNFRCLYCANPDTIDTKGGVPTRAEEILTMAKNQQPFFGKRGGITFSGGEPTLQAKVLLPLFKALRAEGINICLDTNGGYMNDSVRELLRETDLVLLDVKQHNPDRHDALTKHSNAQTLDTLRWLESEGRPCWMRYVLVPGYSDMEEDLVALGEEFGAYKSIERLEILPYHTFGVHKYEPLNKEYELSGVEQNTPEQLDRAKEILSRYFSLVVVN